MSYPVEHLRTFARLCIGRKNDYARQRTDGRYSRVGRPLTDELLSLHLQGVQTLGTYLIHENGVCSFAVFDADGTTGLVELLTIQARLRRDGFASYLERSRRGGHLYIFLATPVGPALLRSWLMPYYPGDYLPGVMELYPKQDYQEGRYGSLIRVPLGVHRLTGRRYPFVTLQGKKLVSVARTVSDALVWLTTVERVSVPVMHSKQSFPSMENAAMNTHIENKKPSLSNPVSSARYTSIKEWCAAQNPFILIGQYVTLDRRGMGCCPFGEHHTDGKDSHPSFRVYTPSTPGGNCWYCYAWGKGGNVFNFLSMYHRLDARTLWARILSGKTLS